MLLLEVHQRGMLHAVILALIQICSGQHLREVSLTAAKHEWVRQQQAALFGLTQVMSPLPLGCAAAGFSLLSTVAGDEASPAV